MTASVELATVRSVPVDSAPQDCGKITALLKRHSQGDRTATADLFDSVFTELKRIAAARLRGERGNFLLQPTELVNLAYVKLADKRERVWADSTHFFRFVSRVMRHLLIDMAKHEDALKGPGGWVAIPLDDDVTYTICDADELLDIVMIIDRLRRLDERAAAVVEHRFYGGHLEKEIAGMMDLSTKTICRDLEIARSFIKQKLYGNRR